MSSKVPFDLQPIEEEKRDFVSYYALQGDISYDEKPHCSYVPDRIPENVDPENPQKFVGIAIEITSTIIGNLISHPCIVLRRQCQVNRKALRYHLSPFTLIPVILRLQQRQGLKCLWKGAGGIFILRGCSIAVETLIAELTPFPREVSSTSSIKQLAQHVLLKFITFGVLTPFYCASLVETVQSDIASEKPGVLDCLKEGVCRLFKWGTPHSSRLLPIWQLIIPSALYGVSVYIISSLVQSVIRWFISMKQRSQLQGDYSLSECSAVNFLNNISTAHLGALVANIVLFPAETVLHRLYLQGTRTIIDNLEVGFAVLPVISKYEGIIDCFHTIVSEEGASGLYKGFGALLLDYALQLLILKIAKITCQEAEKIFRPYTNKKAVV